MSKKIVIFEGIDCVGKSTRSKLAYELSKHDGDTCSLLHVTGADPNTPDWYRSVFSNGNYSTQILDRGLIGELVYGPRYRGVSRIELHACAALIRKYNIKINLIVALDYDKYMLLQKHRAETDKEAVDNALCMFGDQERFLEIIKQLVPYGITVNIEEVIIGLSNESNIDIDYYPVTLNKAINATKAILLNLCNKIGGNNE